MFSNSTFRQIYISLGKDWEENKRILDNFRWQEHSSDFYEKNPDYYYEGYSDYTALGVLIQNADKYLVNVKNFAQDITIYFAIAAVVGLLFFTITIIKKNSYKIGVLKALGARNSDVTFIFGLETLLISFIAFIFSIPTSIIMMDKINNRFTQSANSDLVFFGIQPIHFLVVFCIVNVVVIMAALIPLIKLYITSPITVIRNNNRK